MSSVASGAGRAVVPFRFAGLPAYSREELVLWNWFQRGFPGRADWLAWLREVCGSLLMRPREEQASLLQTNSLEPGQEPRRHALAKNEISIGRAPENDLVLPAKAIGKTHARITRQGEAYALEDLGSQFGTHAGGVRLAPHRPEPLRDGAQFTIFPYQFTFERRVAWMPEDRVDVQSARSVAATWGVFTNRSESGCLRFPVFVHPVDDWFCLELQRAFLTALVQRLLKPLGLDDRQTTSLSSDRLLLEFVMLSVLEAANRDLQFPFQFELGSERAQPERSPQVRGLALGFSLGLTGLTGAIRAFLPYELLEKMERAAPATPRRSWTARVSWEFPVSAGHVDLASRDLARLETGDVVLFTPAALLLYPHGVSKGWTASLEGGNTWSLRLDKYFDGSVWMPEFEGAEQSAAAAPNLDDLPLRVQVVLGEKELTLAEANGLAQNTILELDCGKSDPVRLAINGKIVGRGELVEIDGKLGVRISEWS